MRVYGLILGILLAAGAGSFARGEEPKPDAKADAAKALDVEFRGIVCPKAKDAPENVVACFIVVPKKFDIVDERKTVNLFAKGDVAKLLVELAKDRAKADIAGTMAEGGINVTLAEAYTGKKKAKLAAKPVNEAGAQPKADAGKSDTPKTKPSDEEF